MIYGGDLMSNFNGAILSKDNEMTKDILLSEIHKLLDSKPQVLIENLNKSNVATSRSISKRDLIHKVVDALYDNAAFRGEISKSILSQYNNADGDAGEKSANSILGAMGGIFGGIAGAISGNVDRKAQQEADRNQLKLALLQELSPKTNWTPIVLITGVLILGGVVAFIALKQK
jgi:hypothetical protein